MKIAMKLFKRENGIYYVQLGRGKKKSLQTGDKRLAEKIYRELKKKTIEGKLISFEKAGDFTFSDFCHLYEQSRYDLSNETIKKDWKAFRAFGNVFGMERSISVINDKDIEEFKSVCMNRGVKPVSVNSYLRHLKAAFNYAQREGFIKRVPRIKMLKTGISLPRFLTDEEIKKILIYTKEHDPYMHRIITVALYTGCRRSEIYGLHWHHIKDNSIQVLGKGNKERYVPLLPEAIEAFGEKEVIFGRIFDKLKPDGITHRFKEICRSVAIEDARFHDLRHTAATHMISCGISLQLIQAILGHANISTTQIYAKIKNDVLIREMQKLTFG